MPSHTLTLDPGRLLAQIQALGAIGGDETSGGRTRLTLSDAERAGRDQLVQWMHELDLEVHIDQIGNIFGILPAARADRADVATPDVDATRAASGIDIPAAPGTLPLPSETDSLPPLMIGSHIDTVRHAGALDGCYGVLAGLAVVRAYRAAGVVPSRAIVVAAFTNEEGVRYQPDMMGSLVYAGGLPLAQALDTVGIDGTRLGDELARIGYAGSMVPGSLVPGEYLELHIEQGPVLEAEGQHIGVVDSLQGISWQRITVQGVANHAGTTPTRLRHDAGYVACAIVAFLREQVVAAAPDTTLATVGSLAFQPDVINVIPQQATFTVDLRDPDEQRLQAAERRLADFLDMMAAREGVRIDTERLVRFEPVVFDAGLADTIEAAAQQLGLPSRRMTSGAGHDAQMMARIAPAAMIFVPSQNGISHNPREHTDEAQLLQGAQVLLSVVQQRLG